MQLMGRPPGRLFHFGHVRRGYVRCQGAATGRQRSRSRCPVAADVQV